jgi:histidinol-phosphate aminotransferase
MPILGLQSPGPSTPSHFNLEAIVRPNILSLIPYRAARDDYSEGILLDANENALGPCLPTSATRPEGAADPEAAEALALLTDQEVAGLNRYPSPTHDELKRTIAKLRGVPNEQWVFLGVGSDEVIDMLFRVVCVPAKDAVITLPPTYGMYKVAAQTNDIGVVQVPLITEGGRFEVDEAAVSARVASNADSPASSLTKRSMPTQTPSSCSSAHRGTQQGR